MSSSFDPVTFLNATFEGSNSLQPTPIPIGEYLMQIDKVEYAPQTIRKGDRAGETMHKVNFMCKISAPGIAEADGKLVRLELILDITPQGAIDTSEGMNFRLGRLRDALGMNEKSFSFSAMQGGVLRGTVAHDVDPEDSSIIYSRVKSVAKQ